MPDADALIAQLDRMISKMREDLLAITASGRADVLDPGGKETFGEALHRRIVELQADRNALAARHA